MAFIAGKDGFVTIGAVQYKFDVWKLSMGVFLAKVTNFTSGGFQEVLPCVRSATLTLNGPHDVGGMAFALGTTYAFAVGYGAFTLNCNGCIEKLDPVGDVNDAARLQVTAQSNGVFSVAVT